MRDHPAAPDCPLRCLWGWFQPSRPAAPRPPSPRPGSWHPHLGDGGALHRKFPPWLLISGPDDCSKMGVEKRPQLPADARNAKYFSGCTSSAPGLPRRGGRACSLPFGSFPGPAVLARGDEAADDARRRVAASPRPAVLTRGDDPPAPPPPPPPPRRPPRPPALFGFPG